MTEVGVVFSKLKEVFHLKRPEKVLTTNFLFRTYVILTPTIFFLFSILVFAQQLLQSHIRCLKPNGADIRTSVINQYCFIMGTYTVPSLYGSPTAAHVGVGQHIPSQSESHHHHYFQWVPFVLFIQAMIFHLPNLLWKTIEKCRIQGYCSPTAENLPSLRIRKTSSKSCEDDVTQRVLDNAGYKYVSSLGYNWFYAGSFFTLELLNMFIMIGSFALTDWFLSGQFQNYGLDWMRYLRGENSSLIFNPATEASLPSNLISPMDKMFPKVTKCSFKTFGPSGGIVNYDILCVLSLNVIHEKIYLILWFWFALLFFLSCVGTFYRVFLWAFPSARNSLLLRRTVGKDDRVILKDKILRRIDYSDWFILKRISDNVDRFQFVNFAKVINKKLKGQHNNDSASCNDERIRDLRYIEMIESSPLVLSDSDSDNLKLSRRKAHSVNVNCQKERQRETDINYPNVGVQQKCVTAGQARYHSIHSPEKDGNEFIELQEVLCTDDAFHKQTIRIGRNQEE
jgi:hypothetical protein